MLQWSTGSRSQLLQEAAATADQAITCGFLGAVLLEGMLSAAPPAAATADLPKACSTGGQTDDSSHLLTVATPELLLPADDGAAISVSFNQAVDASSNSTADLPHACWQKKVLGYGRPTYFGMMVAAWLPQTSCNQMQGPGTDHSLQ